MIFEQLEVQMAGFSRLGTASRHFAEATFPPDSVLCTISVPQATFDYS